MDFKIRKFLKDDRGQALVELALIMPLLIMLLFGVIEFGRVFNAYLTVTSASREGARAATLGADNSTIQQKVKEATPHFDQSKLTVDIVPFSDRKRGDSVSITVNYSIKLYAPLIDIALSNPVDVSNKTVMRME